VRWLTQTIAVTAMNLRSLGQRVGPSSVAVVGFACVVAVFVAVLSIAEGFRRVMERGVSPDVALVLRTGSDTEMSSGLEMEATRIVKDAPGVLRTASGPVASAELFVVVDVPKRATGTDANVPLRGVEEAAFVVREDLSIVEGRTFTPGRNEVIVGSGAALEFAGLDVGNTLRWGDNDWTVVGRFDAGGTVADSELWCDIGVLAPAYRRGSSAQAVYARLESPESFESLREALESDPRLDVSVQTETAYYAGQSQALANFISIAGNLIALLMGIGAAFGALNTMYTAVSARAREIATLRALGFRGGPVVLSVLGESLALALLGGAVGGVLAYLAFDGFHAATLNFQSFSQVAFAFRVTPGLLVQGFLWALGIGVAGGLFPAIRAARIPVTMALRAP
jgi:putative ABC transport system permease protein